MVKENEMKKNLSVYMYIAIFAIVIFLLGYCMQGFYGSDTDAKLDTSLARQRIEAEYEATKIAQVRATEYAPRPSGTLNISETTDTYVVELRFRYEDFDLDCKVEKSKEYIIQDNHKPTEISFSVNKEYCSSRSGYRKEHYTNVFWGSRYFRSMIILEISPDGKISYEIVIHDVYGPSERFKKGIDINLNLLNE